MVIATEKKLPTPLIDESTVQKILMLTPNIAVVYSGMGPDFRVLCRKGRKAAAAYHRARQAATHSAPPTHRAPPLGPPL